MRTILLAATLIAAPAAAQAPAVHVSGWARAGIGSTAAYLSIHNGQPGADRLLSVSSPAAASASVHATSVVNGVSRMRGAGAVPLPRGGQVSMRPGGMHVMLMGLKAPLRPGTNLALTLQFARAGKVSLVVPVLPAGSSGPAGSHHGH